MQLKENDYWDAVYAFIDMAEDMAQKWQQLAWQSVRQATIISVDEDYPSIEEIIEHLKVESEQYREVLDREMESLRQSYSSKMIDDGKAEFSVKWEEAKPTPTPSNDAF